MINALLRLLAPWHTLEASGADGALAQRERLQLVAAFACARWYGDLVEIGCLHGSTTVRFADVAKQFNRTVVAIDPWQVGTQNCSGGEYEIFTQTIEPYQAYVKTVRARSDSPEAKAALSHRPLAFAFIDGLHERVAAFQDFLLTQAAHIIAVDDTNWSGELREALCDMAATRHVITCGAFRESYLLRAYTDEMPTYRQLEKFIAQTAADPTSSPILEPAT